MKFRDYFNQIRGKYIRTYEIASATGKKFVSHIPSREQAEQFAVKTRSGIDHTMKGLNTEASETKRMAKSFFRLLESKLDLKNRKEPPTEEEVKEALEQLKDVGRIGVFATISILPGGGFSLIGLELLARKYGIRNFTFIPSAFRKKKTIKKPMVLPLSNRGESEIPVQE